MGVLGTDVVTCILIVVSYFFWLVWLVCVIYCLIFRLEISLPVPQNCVANVVDDCLQVLVRTRVSHKRVIIGGFAGFLILVLAWVERCNFWCLTTMQNTCG